MTAHDLFIAVFVAAVALCSVYRTPASLASRLEASWKCRNGGGSRG